MRHLAGEWTGFRVEELTEGVASRPRVEDEPRRPVNEPRATARLAVLRGKHERRAFYERVWVRIVKAKCTGVGTTNLSGHASAGTDLRWMRADDLRVVLDAVGSERAVLFGESEGGSLVAFFAAAHPQRVLALIL